MINPTEPDYTNTPASDRRPLYDYVGASGDERPAVSIITPAFNTGSIFEETVTCVSRQSIQNYEWIIVDDGSTDAEFVSRLARLEAEDQRVRVIRQENRGPGAARNRAVREARADYICQLDSDDLIEPTFVEKCLWALTSNPQYSFCNSYGVGFGDKTYLWPLGFELGEQFLQENHVSPHAVIRRSAHLEAGGYDESIRHGHEDWDYWLNMADKGHWGYTIPEYLLWYRRRANSRIWETVSDPARHDAFRDYLQHKYKALLDGRFPEPRPLVHMAFETIQDELPFQNPLRKPADKRRLLMLVPWLTMGGADKFNLDLVEQLTRRGYEMSICTTLEGASHWYQEFARFTPDIFTLHHFLRPVDYPRFLRYLLVSRRVDVALVSNSTLGYQLLPYLRSRCPGVTYVDYSHMEEEYWKNDGSPRLGVGYQELLDLNIASTRHLKEWMVARGGDGGRIEVCYTNIDPEKWDPTRYSRGEIRRGLDVPEAVPLILYAGRLCDQKRPRLFAEVLLELARQNSEFLCLVAGDGELRGYLEAFVRQNKLEGQIHLLGAVPNERIQEMLAASDIFFLPSQWEGLALTLFEAMAMQVVPVAADVGGQRELVTPECGFLIPKSENELGEYVSALKSLIESPELRASMGWAGRQRIMEHFRIDQMASRMSQVLNRSEELSKMSPRPGVGKGLGLECATLAIEYTRLEQFAGRMRANRYLPDGSVESLKRWREVARRLYWRLAGLPGARRVYRIVSAVPIIARTKSFVVRLLGIS
jgi:glycosyltransferase involved in cell wall biosynthesis